jgi:hypothetical protein
MQGYARNEKFLTIAEYETALRYITNVTHRTQFLLMGDAGLRVTEVCTQRWTNIIPDLVGHDVEARQLERLMQQGVSTVVVGSVGIG